MAEILTDSEFDEVSERIVEHFPHDDNFDHELLSADLCRECSGAVDDHKANCIVPEIYRLITSHRALAAERDAAYKTSAEIVETSVKTQDELARRIRTLESACEAARTHLKIIEHDMPVDGYEQRRDLIKQLEGAIKHG